MKYFKHKGLDYHCSEIFNWVAVDLDGTVTLFQNKPFKRKEYWTSGHTSSYDYFVYVENKVMCLNWSSTLVEL